MKDKRFFVIIGNEYGCDITDMTELPLMIFEESTIIFDKYVEEGYPAIFMFEVTETEIKETKRLLTFE